VARKWSVEAEGTEAGVTPRCWGVGWMLSRGWGDAGGEAGAWLLDGS
jgi:hypothetical protein